MLDKSSVYNILAEGMCYLDKGNESISTFLTFNCLAGIIQIPHVILKPGVSFYINFAPFCNILDETKAQN